MDLKRKNVCAQNSSVFDFFMTINDVFLDYQGFFSLLSLLEKLVNSSLKFSIFLMMENFLQQLI